MNVVYTTSSTCSFCGLKLGVVIGELWPQHEQQKPIYIFSILYVLYETIHITFKHTWKTPSFTHGNNNKNNYKILIVTQLMKYITTEKNILTACQSSTLQFNVID